MTRPPSPASLDMADFCRVELVVATVAAARANPRARGPALVLDLDLGPELGHRTSSAQLGANYQPNDLVGTQVIVVANLPPRRVAGVESQVLVLAAVDPTRGTRLLRADVPLPNGTRIS
jgi:tRNA-binding protein